MAEISTFRLYLLRGLYLLIAVGLAVTIWPRILAFGLPLWRSGQLTAATGEPLYACLMGLVLVPIAVPWGYVIRHYVRAGGDRWRGAGPGGP